MSQEACDTLLVQTLMDYDTQTYQEKLEGHYLNVLDTFSDFVDSFRDARPSELTTLLDRLEEQAAVLDDAASVQRAAEDKKDKAYRRYINRITYLIEQGYSENESLRLVRDDEALPDDVWKQLIKKYHKE